MREMKKRNPWPAGTSDGDRSSCACGHYLGSHDGAIPHRCWVAGCTCKDFASASAPEPSEGGPMPSEGKWTRRAHNWYSSELGDVEYDADRDCWAYRGFGRNRRWFPTAEKAMQWAEAMRPNPSTPPSETRHE